MVDGTTFYTDSTHKKANANKNKYNDEIIEIVKERRKWLEEEINEERIKEESRLNTKISLRKSILKLVKQTKKVDIITEIIKKKDLCI